MTPFALHAALADLLVHRPMPPPGVLAGVDHEEPQASLILNAADDASIQLQNQDLNQVIVLPPGPIPPGKRALLDELLLDLDRPNRVLVLIWREAPDAALAEDLAQRIQVGVDAAVFLSGPAAVLPSTLAALVPVWYALD